MADDRHPPSNADTTDDPRRGEGLPEADAQAQACADKKESHQAAQAKGRRAVRPPFSLIRDTLSHETVDALEQLLAAAKRGEIIGVAYAAMLKQRNYIVNTAGEAYRNPTFSLGMVRVLDDELMQRVRGYNS